MKEIFLIGDSISLHYHPYLKELLNNKAVFQRKGDEDDINLALDHINEPLGANGGDSALVLAYMNELKKKGKKYSIILFNCGLHDIRTDRMKHQKQIVEEEYQKNIQKILDIAKQIAHTVIWISTTPVDDDRHNNRENGYLRYNEDVLCYNRIANTIMRENKMEIIDLYTFTKNISVDKNERYRDHVHFSDKVCKMQANYIYSCIEPLL